MPVLRCLPLAAALLLACAHVGRAVPGEELAGGGFREWMERGGPGAASARFASALRKTPADPWARLGGAALARRSLDGDTEAAHLLALVAGSPWHPLVPVAARRLADLAESSPPISRAVEAGLEPLLAAGKLRGAAAYRVRLARAAAADARGDLALAARVRGEAGSVLAWTLIGPCGAYPALEIDHPFPPEVGEPRCPTPPGTVPAEARTLPATAGGAVIEGEPAGADIFYLAADVRLARGGRYLVAVGSTATHRAFLDGVPLAERRAFGGFPPAAVMVPRQLEAGVHRLLVKVGRGGAGRVSVGVSFAREDGAPSDATASPARELARLSAGPLPPVTFSATERVAELAREAGPAVARWVVAADVLPQDRETAKGLVEAALAILPYSAPLHALHARVLRDDATLSERVARERAEAEYEKALLSDRGDAATRLARAELMRVGDRFDDAQANLETLAEPEAGRPRALLLSARIALARGFTETAERLAGEAFRQSGSCPAAEILYDLSSRRGAVSREDELASALALCPGGHERSADHRRRRGDGAGAVAALEPAVRSAPARIDLRLALATALIAGGDPARASAELEDVARIWPREARIQKRLAEALELAGNVRGAREARRRALRLDGTDLQLRRAIASEDGTEVLAEYAEDGREAIRAYERSGMHPSTSSVLVLDAAAVETDAGGAVTERTHQVFKVLDQRGVERFGEVNLPPGAELLAVRTIKARGGTLEPEEAGEKHAISLPGLEPGDYVEWEFLRSHAGRGAAIPGFTADPFYFQLPGSPMWRSSYVVAAPKGAGLEADAHHMAAPPVKTEGGREVVRALATEVPALLEEPDAPPEAEYMPHLVVGTGAGREAMHLAVADTLLPRTRPTREVTALAAAAAAGPARRLAGEALLRAAYEKVDEVIEGQGGSLSDEASQVLARRRGNRNLLLKAVCAALGIEARLAMVRPFGVSAERQRFPRPDLYGYAVVRARVDGKTFWLDLNTRYAPFGTIPEQVRGQEALVLPEPGESPEVTRTPEQTGDEGRRMDVKIAIESGGDATITATERYLGFEAAAAKGSLERLDAQARRQAVERALARNFPGFVLESLRIVGERHAEEPLSLEYRGRVPTLARVGGGQAVIEMPIYPLRLGARWVTRGSRAIPLLVPSDDRTIVYLDVLPPEGMRAVPAPASEVVTPFGSFHRVESERNGHLVREDRFELRRGRIAPGRYPDFVRFAGAVDEVQGRPMTFAGAGEAR
jgi:Tfp pilus assembly protein PilF